jgi:sulfite exporter TauE/SafE
MLDYSNLNSLPAVFLVGIIASVSSCTSTLSSVILSLDKNIKSHIYFNLSRVVSFTILGGILGLVGSVFQVNQSLNAYIILAIGVLTLLFGLKSLNFFKFLSNYNFSISPKVLNTLKLDKILESSTNIKPAILGFLSFLIPCGFTQTVQLFAVASGSFQTGAITMFIFSLGTIPGLLGIGSLVSKVKSQLFSKAVAVSIIILALINIHSGLEILSPAKNVEKVLGSSLEVTNGVQIIRMEQGISGYTPNKINLKKGVPVRWIVNSTDQRSCAASLYSKELKISKLLKNGENIIEFTPDQEGYINFSCSMGMYNGVFIVS